MSSSDSFSHEFIQNHRTRVAMHFLDAAPIEDEPVTVEGWLTYYDEKDKSWKPLKGKLSFYLDNRMIGESESNELGIFSFTFLAPVEGRHTIEARFKGKPGYEPSSKKMEFRVLKGEEKRRIMRIARNAMILILFFIFFLIFLMFYVKMTQQ
jgi:hypothetical protein